MTTPDRSLSQRLEALEAANRIRTYRARLKEDVKAGRVGWLEVLDGGHPDVQTMKLTELILAVPKVGPMKVRRVLVYARISPAKTLGGLSGRQRQDLLGAAQALAPTMIRYATTTDRHQAA